jgi:hypothetical protein
MLQHQSYKHYAPTALTFVQRPDDRTARLPEKYSSNKLVIYFPKV